MKQNRIEQGIFRNPNGTYDVRVATHVNGKYIVKRKRSCPTLGEARRTKKVFDDEVGELRNRVRNGIPTWKKACEDYYADAEHRLAPSTLYTQRKSLEAHTDSWSDIYVNEFYKELITSHILAVLSDKGTDTQNNLAKYVRNVFKLQVDKGTIRHNPASSISFGKKKRRKKLEAMVQSEVLFLLKKAQEYNHEWFPIWFATYMVGLRPMEGFVLEWPDLDFENGLIHITKTLCAKTKTVKEPKDGDARIVPMNKGLRKFLLELKAKHGNERYVLPRLKGWKHGEAAKILRSFQRDIGIKETDFKSLRASFITHSLLAGVPATKVQEMVGHADLKTTSNHYVRISGSDLKGATDPIDIDLSQDLGDVIDMSNFRS